MKKNLFLSVVLAASLASASNYDYEVTPVAGYNYAQSKTGLNNNELYGAEIQYNALNSIIKPELSFLYSPSVGFDTTALNAKTGGNYTSAKSDVFRTAINGVYEYGDFSSVVPLIKAGLGYEKMSNTFNGENQNGVFADLGVGAKIPVYKQIALKVEAIYMLKNNQNSWGNNLALLAGINIPFGAHTVEQPAPAPVAVTPEPVDGDDDSDGVTNSNDQCLNTPAGAVVDVNGCRMDDDKDGVFNAQDECLHTVFGAEVDAKGCKIEKDDDKDGVLNAQDLCPATPMGTAVNVDGCPIVVNLHVNFDNDSANVKKDSMSEINKYADFLTTYKNYSAKIVGYTDSKGSTSYNQKLSEKRANSVKKILVEEGVNASQVSSVGMGEANPVADNATKEGRASNRRIEAELIRN